MRSHTTTKLRVEEEIRAAESTWWRRIPTGVTENITAPQILLAAHVCREAGAKTAMTDDHIVYVEGRSAENVNAAAHR